MATVILPPQDCLRPQGLLLPRPLKSRRNPNPKPSPNPNFDNGASCSARRRRSPPAGVKSHRQANRGRSRSGEPSAAAKISSPKGLVMGQVKILKRGEVLTPDRGVDGVDCSGDLDLGLGSTDRLGPDPDLMQKELKVAADGIYAGSGAFFASPPPSSVPVPSFIGGNNGAATSDLRRLLRLDL